MIPILISNFNFKSSKNVSFKCFEPVARCRSTKLMRKMNSLIQFGRKFLMSNNQNNCS